VQNRGLARAGYIVLFFATLIPLSFLRYALAEDRLTSDPVSLFVVGPMMVVLWSLMALLLLGRSGATAVEVSGESVRFEYGPRKSRTWSWTDPKFRLVIDVTSGTAGPPSWGAPVYAGADFHYFRNYLQAEAYGAILTEARAKGMRITETQSPQPGFTRVTITHPARRS
jgi:hypothetical protein